MSIEDNVSKLINLAFGIESSEPNAAITESGQNQKGFDSPRRDSDLAYGDDRPVGEHLSFQGFDMRRREYRGFAELFKLGVIVASSYIELRSIVKGRTMGS